MWAADYYRRLVSACETLSRDLRKEERGECQTRAQPYPGQTRSRPGVLIMAERGQGGGGLVTETSGCETKLGTIIIHVLELASKFATEVV